MSTDGRYSNSSTEIRVHHSIDGFDETKIQLREIRMVKKTEENHLSCVVMDKKYEEPLSPVACLTSEQLLESYILGIVGFKKEIEVNSLKGSLKASLGEHQRFSSVLIKDKRNNLKWCLTDQVDMNDHVIVPCLSPEFVQNPNFVNEYTASLATAPPLNPSRPLWEVHVLNATSGEAAATLVFRIHHSVGDCVSMLSLIVNSTRTVSDPKSLPTIPHQTFKGKERLCFVQTMYSWGAAFWFTFIISLHYLATLLWKHDSSSLTGMSKLNVCKKRLAYVTINMDDISLVKKTVNGTVNDVMMGVLSAGLVRCLSRRYANDMKSEVLAEKTANGEKGTDRTDHLPPNLRVRARVAVNRRQLPVLKDLGSNMQNPTQSMWGNKFGFWLFPLPMVKYENPLEYCRAVTSTSRMKKLSFEISATYALTKFMVGIGAKKAMAHITGRLVSNTSLGFSNVIGPVEEIEYGDNPVTHIIPTAHVNHAPIIIHFISYSGKGKLIALVSEDVISDPELLCMDCAAALQQMKQAALFQIENSIS